MHQPTKIVSQPSRGTIDLDPRAHRKKSALNTANLRTRNGLVADCLLLVGQREKPVEMWLPFAPKTVVPRFAIEGPLCSTDSIAV
ncbi:hypothetical protein SPHINGOR109_60053 [Sphingorhabdus sp. 109]|nr:hypothetical protein SPHINGOR109_60053 [Sphingorhabdus sp. 109]